MKAIGVSSGCRVPGAGCPPGITTAPLPGTPHTAPRTRKYRWRRDRRGASGVVVTLLILMVAVGALSMFMGIYVPLWGKDTEAAHMKLIQTQMLGLKSNIDSQILAGKTSTYTTRLTIGDDGGPVFHLTRAPGILRLGPDAGLYVVSNSTDPNDAQAISRGMLEYSSQNTHFVDQTYRYENGALLVIQGGRAVMKAGPHFDARRDADGNYTLGISLISLNGVAATRQGTGDVQIESTLNVYDVTTYSGSEWTTGRNMTLNITTRYPSVWADFFNSSLRQSGTGLSPTDYNITVGSGIVSARFVNLNRLELGIAIMEMQLGM